MPQPMYLTSKFAPANNKLVLRLESFARVGEPPYRARDCEDEDDGSRALGCLYAPPESRNSVVTGGVPAWLAYVYASQSTVWIRGTLM